MKKRIKRLISMMLVLCMCLGMLPSIANASEDYRAWSQADSRWGSLSLGTSSSTVASSGCTVTSVTKLIIQAGLKDSSSFNVATMVNWLNENSGFTAGGYLYWGKPSEYISEFKNAGTLLAPTDTISNYSSSEYNTQLLSWVKEGYHLILQVNNGGHWVAVDEAKSIKTGEIYIMDSKSNAVNADITLASRYSSFSRVQAYTGGKTPISTESTTFDFVGFENNTAISGTYKFWWKQVGFGDCDVNLDLDGTALGTIYPDENGFFSYSFDSTKYENGTYTLGAILRSSSGAERYVTRTIVIDNPYFNFWGGEDNTTITGTHKFWWKQVGYGDCCVSLDLDGTALATIYPDENGLFSYSLDSTQYENGTYTLGAYICNDSGAKSYVTRTIIIDNPYFNFWGYEDNTTISGTYKFWWKHVGYGNCSVNLDLNGTALATIYPDENGLFSYSLDSTQYENGTYTLGAQIFNENGAGRYVTKTVIIENAPAQYTISYDANGGTGAPESQLKTHGVDLVLSDTIPVLDGYRFMGWVTDTEADAVYQPGGSYTSDCSVTLYAVWEAESIPLFNLAGTTMSLGNSLAINFVLDTANLEGNDNYAVITKSYADGREPLTVNIPQTQWVKYSSDPNSDTTMRYFTFNGVSAKEMTDQFTVVVYNAAGQQMTTTHVDSVADYSFRAAQKELAKTNCDAEKLTLYVDMINYGAAAQTYFGYATDNLASAVLTEELKGYASENVEVTDSRIKGEGYLGTTLSLKNEILMNFVFSNAVAENAAYAAVSFTNHYGDLKTIEVPAENFQAYGEVGKYISVTSMSVADCYAAITLTLYDAEGNAITSVVDSVEGYISRTDGTDALYPEIMKFANAAYNYFH